MAREVSWAAASAARSHCIRDRGVLSVFGRGVPGHRGAAPAGAEARSGIADWLFADERASSRSGADRPAAVVEASGRALQRPPSAPGLPPCDLSPRPDPAL